MSTRQYHRSLWYPLFAAVFLVTAVHGAAADLWAATRTSISSPYLTVSVNSTGVYRLMTKSPAWTFGGRIGRTLSNIAKHKGRDGIGSYREIVFTYMDSNNASRGAGIRTYQSSPIVIFVDSTLSTIANTFRFPRLSTYPVTPYHLNFRGGHARYTFAGFAADSPWVYFDGQGNTFVLSAASNFMIANTAKSRSGTIVSGIDPAITTLPAGFTHRTLLVFGQGINEILELWGHALTNLQGKIRPSNDDGIVLNTLGYWTDHGAEYFYKYDSNLGYEGTLKGVYNSFKQAGIPLGYMQLDEWWYPKGPSRLWSDNGSGIYTYKADRILFPNALKTFQEQLNIPLITHAKYIDLSSPYRKQYAMSNNVSTDQAYWKMISRYLKLNAVVTYEQDWLNKLALPAMNLTDPDAFMNNMATAMSRSGLTIQYCMALPRHFLQSSRYNNVTSIRVSKDRFNPDRWDAFLYGSRLASALGLWPWSDVFMSTETQNLLLSTLSAGVVGVGDPIGAESASNLLQTIRADGVIVKPDVPIVPVDGMYIQDAQATNQPMVAYTHTDFGSGMKALYVFAYARTTNTPATASFTPLSLGLSGSGYVYNYFSGTGTVLPAGGTFTDTVGSGSYYLVVPIGASGIGFLGDRDKFVSWGKKRILQVQDSGSIQVKIRFADGETSLTMYGYARSEPNVTADDGSIGVVFYDSATGIFSYPVSPGSDGSATVTMRPG